MDHEKQMQRRSFWAAFLLTFTVLVVIMVVTVMAVQPSVSHRQQNQTEEPSYSYHPQAQDTLTMVVIGESQSRATDVLLIRFNPQYGQVPLALLPVQTAVTVQEQSMTLAQVYDRSGAMAVRDALAEELGIVIDRYAVLTRDIFIRIAEKAGSATYTIPYDISYERDGYRISLAAGERKLDARDICNLIGNPGFDGDAEEKSRVAGGMIAEIINQNLDAASEDRSSSLFKLAVNLVDTDITFADYELRRQAADFVSKLDTKIAGNLPLSGSYENGNASFILSDNFVHLVQQYFQATGSGR